MSPTDSNLSGGRGKRKSGKPGRFDPSEPLHMTTRRAARSKSNGATPSVNGSVDGNSSRRGSLNDSRPSTSHSNSSEYTNKSRRTSDGSMPAASPALTPNGHPFKTEPNNADVSSLALTSTKQSPSPSRKRKRSTSTKPLLMRSATPSALADEPLQSLESNNESDIPNAPTNDITEEAMAESDSVEPMQQDEQFNREAEAEASQNSSQSNDQRLQRQPFDDHSAEVTPAVSNAASPPSGNSDTDQLTPPKQEDVAMEDEVDIDQDENLEPNEEIDIDTELIEEAEEAEEGDDATGQVRSGSSGERPRRRFGGRRRAQHPIWKVEKAMQRQAEIKAYYRTVARALKPVLAEIAKRTVDDLEANPELHTQAAEYGTVKQQLDERLERRKQRIQLHHDYQAEQLKRTLEQHSEQVKMTCRAQIEDAEDRFLSHIEAEMLRIEREAQMETNKANARAEAEQANNVNAIAADAYETEDEDGVLPRPKSAAYGFKKPSKLLDKVYLSRSRMYMEPGLALAESEARNKMRKLMGEIPEDELPMNRKRKFAVMDDAPRNAAAGRKEVDGNFDILTSAAKEVERATKKQRIIRNEDCHGLQLLGDLASRPSLTAATKPVKGSHLRRARVAPQLQIQTGDLFNSPIPVEMSPRTSQALNDRFEGAMLPPTTPRRALGPPTLLRSPEATRMEATLPSPTMNHNRFGGPQPQQPLIRGPDVRPESRRSQYIESARSAPDTRPVQDSRLEMQFSPPQQSERRVEFPLWREYPREGPGALHRRSSSHSDRPPINMGLGPPLRDERHGPIGLRMPEVQKASEPPKEAPPPFVQMHGRAPLWQDRPSQPGAADVRFRDQRSPPPLPQRPTYDVKSPMHARNPSMSFAVQDHRSSGILPKEDPNRPRSKGTMGAFRTKTNKEERGGLSRRNFSDQRKMSKPIGSTGPAGSPPLAVATAGSPKREVPPPPMPWPAPPQHAQHPQQSSPVPPPPAPSYQQSPYSQPPPPAAFRPTQQTPTSDQFPSRNSFPPRPSSSNFDRLPPTPLYVMPQQQPAQQQREQPQPQHPPPPGVPPEQYNRPFAPPPPPGYQPPATPQSAPPLPSPQTPFPQSATGPSYMSQFGGPPLAPAGGNAYHPPGFRPAPAFAQQAQQQQQQAQQQGGNGHRRRTQSDASNFSKFHTWNPPSKRT